ncbi:sensor histidine kinase [Thalassospira alkalitolerans]|uniref:histidine kinase n=1 Tax=Thalassospira alkalitolerans TaxID=1293890 RepID=A0A1Y2LB94_9PROT|nr:sensor histidine kinase [Thalassospira alkalitolerans]OSQ47939.1 hypothetical protein TALK_09990 [Thalassospira alkalitolerans]
MGYLLAGITMLVIVSVLCLIRPALSHPYPHDLVIGQYSVDRMDVDLAPLIERLATQRPVNAPSDLVRMPQDDFKPIIGAVGNGYTLDTVWYRMPIIVTEVSAEPIDQKLYLEIAPTFLNTVDLTIVDASSLIPIWHNEVGDHIARDQAHIHGRKHIREWPRLATGKYWLVIGITTNSAQILTARIKSESVLIDENMQDTFLYGLYLGISLIGFLVYFTLGLLIRDRAILWYGFHILALFMLTAGISGYAHLLLSDFWILSSDALTGAGTALSIGTSVAMWSYIIELDRHKPTLFRCLIAYAIITCLCGISATSDIYIYFTLGFFLPQIGVTLLILGYLLYLGGKNTDRRKYYLYVIALGVPAVASIIHLLMLLGLAPINTFTRNCYQVASLVHLFLLGIAMAYRTHELTRRRVAANRHSTWTNQLADDQREFITMLSHEFRTPLAIIQRAAEMTSLHMQDAPDAVKNRISTIRVHASQLSELVNVFLTKDTLDSTNFVIAPKSTILAPFLSDFIKRRQREFPNHDIGLTDTGITIINIDRTLIERALSNLIENARKYAPKAYVRIGFNHRSDGFVYIRVVDNGPGIPPDDLAMVSDAFYRGTTSGTTHGVGLGLHITNRIVAAHQGRMSVSVGEKGGTTILIRLPYDRTLTNNTIAAAHTDINPPPATASKGSIPS